MSIRANMRNNLGTAALAACAGVLATPAGAAPRIEGPASRECRDTLSVATTAFHSTAFRLNDTISQPQGARVQVVMQPAAGEDVTVDSTVLKSLPPPKSAPNDAVDTKVSYWQIAPIAGTRWVVLDKPFGWRGDAYDLYAIDDAVTETGFVPTGEPDPRKILSDIWAPPMMLRNTRTGAVWAVNAASSDTPDVWSVYAAGEDGVKARCRIDFGPKVKTVFGLLPAPVRALAVDLDGTLGDGRNEGTLHPTDRIRGEVIQAWMNTALRPWAVTNTPDHSRRDVDAGLRHWSGGVRSFRVLYRRIQAEYPAAVDALSSLYVRRFAKTPEAAHALAEHNLDVVYRSHYVFSQDYIHPAPPPKP